MLDKLERKISGLGAVIAKKQSTLLISNEDMDDITKIRELLEKSVLLIDGATETIKHEIKHNKVDCLGLWGHVWFHRYSTYGFIIDTTCCFFIDKFYNLKKESWEQEKNKKVYFFLIIIPF